jgi:hypothetical protein
MGSTTTSLAPPFSFDITSLLLDEAENTFDPADLTATINFLGSAVGRGVDEEDDDETGPVVAGLCAGIG